MYDRYKLDIQYIIRLVYVNIIHIMIAFEIDIIPLFDASQYY